MNELQSVTDIDEVIKYAEREAEGCHQTASAYHTDEGVYLQEETRFQYKAILWENIHEWLEELKELRKKQRPHGEWTIRKNDDGHGVYCSECDTHLITLSNRGLTLEEAMEYLKDHIEKNKFCFNCGADMRKEGEQNGENK